MQKHQHAGIASAPSRTRSGAVFRCCTSLVVRKAAYQTQASINRDWFHVLFMCSTRLAGDSSRLYHCLSGSTPGHLSDTDNKTNPEKTRVAYYRDLIACLTAIRLCQGFTHTSSPLAASLSRLAGTWPQRSQQSIFRSQHGPCMHYGATLHLRRFPACLQTSPHCEGLRPYR